jgi:arsenate reductase
MIKVYHNPRCRKSREALQFLEEKNLDFEVVLYLNEPLSETELAELIKKLNITAIDLIRKEESVWKTEFKDKNLSEKELIRLMIQEPRLMQRPIVVIENKAVIARPADSINDLL